MLNERPLINNLLTLNNFMNVIITLVIVEWNAAQRTLIKALILGCADALTTYVACTSPDMISSIWVWNWLSALYICINTLRPRQNGRHSPYDIYKLIFLNDNVSVSIKISLNLFTGVQLTIFQHWFRWWLGLSLTAVFMFGCRWILLVSS